MFTMRLPKDIDNTLTLLAKTTNRSKSFYVLEALTSDKSLEDLVDIYVVESAMEEFKNSNDKVISLKEVMNEYGMEY